MEAPTDSMTRASSRALLRRVPCMNKSTVILQRPAWGRGSSRAPARRSRVADASGKPALAFTIEGKMNKPDIKVLSPREAGRIIQEAIKKGVAVDLAKIDNFAGGK